MPSKSRVLALQFSRLGALLTFLILGAGNAMAAGGGHEALPPGAEEVARPLGIPITNSMVMVWVVAGVLILAAGPDVVRLVPPLTITGDEVQTGLERLTKALKELAQ